MNDQNIAAEVLRCRDRIHAVAGNVVAVEMRVGNVERQVRELGEQVKHAADNVDSLLADRVIEQAVRAAVKSRSRLELTWVQRVAAAVVTALTVVTFLHDLLS